MPDLPHVVLSCAVSVDGCLDDSGPRRLILSNEQDFDQVDGERAAADAILVGANTIRRDDPRLLVRDAKRQRARVRAGRPANPAKVTLTRSGRIDPTARAFADDGARKLVYCATTAARDLAERLGDRAEVVDAGERPGFGWLLADLARRGVRRLLVEGGSGVLGALLTGGLADELRLAIAPVLVGDPAAPRFTGPTNRTGVPTRLRLVRVEELAGVAVLRYRIGDRLEDG